MTDLSPRQHEGRVAVESAVFATLVDEDEHCHQILQEAIDKGLTEEVTTGAVGLAAFVVQVLARQAGRDPAEMFGEFMRRPL